jgi:hypothetical protein
MFFVWLGFPAGAALFWLRGLSVVGVLKFFHPGRAPFNPYFMAVLS